MIRNQINKIIGISAIVICLMGCNNEQSSEGETVKSGTIHISVDETFKPVMEEQIKMFEALHPQAHIIAHYKTEADCLRDLFTDTLNRMVFVTRGLTKEEDYFFKDSLFYYPKWDNIATDAITIVINKNSKDSVFTKERLEKQFSGKINRNQKVVFDGLNATSTIRYALDSILRGKKFDSSVVKAVKSSKEVLEFVANDIDAIGFVGFSWIGNPEDTVQVNMLKKIKIAYVACDVCEDTPFVKPVQESILTRRYPLVRGLHYILKENYSGLGTGFVNFLKHERGQLIFKRAYLASRMTFMVRQVRLKEEL